jgi:hypothetical protein
VATYSALRDQSNTVWYLTVSSTAELALSSTVPPGTNVTPSQPYWLAIDAADGRRWYVWPTPTGELDVATTAPPTGAGALYPSGLPLVDAAGTAWTVRVANWGELFAAGGGTGLLRADLLPPRLTEAATVVITAGPAPIPKAAADTGRPRVTEAPSGLKPQRLSTDMLPPRLAEAATVIGRSVTQQTAGDTLRPSTTTASATRLIRVPLAGADPVRPRLGEVATRVNVSSTVISKTAADLLRPRLASESAAMVVLVTLPSDAVMLPLPTGIALSRRR